MAQRIGIMHGMTLFHIARTLFARRNWPFAGERRRSWPRRGLLLVLVFGLLACNEPTGPAAGFSAGVAEHGLGVTAPATAGDDEDAVWWSEGEITLPTYPRERYQTDAFDPLYRWPYKRFDVERYRAELPAPVARTYRTVVLENTYLKLIFLPELGGRLWQAIHKATGAPMFYQNDVVKPTHWGQPRQLGWLALGGLEWGLPVVEHGYDWGVPWSYRVEREDATTVAATLTTPADGRLLAASIRVELQAGAASFTVTPTLRNMSDRALDYSFWLNAALAPGSGKHPSGALHVVLPTTTVTLHSTGDARLPAPGATFPWPEAYGRDWSRLGNWQEYLGFFEAPAAHGPFVGVYDPAYDAGAVRVFPPQIARGSKVFGLGWRDALPSDNFSDDNSAYVELHGGVAPSFFEQARLAAGEQLSWREVWYSVHGIHDLSFANEHGALNVVRTAGGLRVYYYPIRPLTDATLTVGIGDEPAIQLAVTAGPDAPFAALVGTKLTSDAPIFMRLTTAGGQVLLAYTDR